MIVDRLRALLAHAFKLSIVSLAGVCLAAPTALAQRAVADEETDRDESMEEIVTTGSRIKRDTYSSVAPLQVISGQVSREIGSIDPSTILQDSSAAAGTQIDVTFQGFVLDNGPGASTVDLRGLGAQRTLVLVNGRRAAPSGVEGVPVAPDLNIIPSSLVQQYEVLLDGASSIYGSDALAGVANIILRKDFDGLELEAYTRIPDYDNGIENTFSAAWGYNGDRGFFGIAADYADGEAVAREERPWSAGCPTYREIDENGKIRTENLLYNYQYGMKTTECVISFGSQRAFEYNGLFGSIYWTEGETNTGIPNLSEATLYDVVLDLDGNGVPDVDFTDYFVVSEDGGTHLLPDRERISVMSYGEYTFEGDMNVTPYYEALYNKREFYAFSGGSILQYEVPGSNPYNPCNPDGVNGVDCGQAYNNVLNNPNYISGFSDRYEGLCAQFGIPKQFCTPGLFGLLLPGDGSVGALPVEAQIGVRGDRDSVTTEVDQTRIVAGIKGDLPMIDWGSLDNWSFDAAFVYSDGSGTSLRRGINEDRLEYSIFTSTIDPDSGQVVCGTETGGDCVPVNLFAPQLYQGLLLNDLSPAESDYLFSDRIMETTYTQSYLNLILTGDLFSLPGGEVAAAIGYEIRNDEIDSIPNDVAAEGQLWGYFRDLGAVGEKTTKEWFAEVEAPIFAGYPGMRELTVNLSTRHTDDEFYGGAYTYSAKLAYRPIDDLLIRATAGTSYRAPNLRENFLLGQSGFRTLFDPCVVPADALVLDPDEGLVYDPSQDTREQLVIDNCVAAGVDPTSLGALPSGNSAPNYSVEVLTGVGRENLTEEKSTSWTAGFSWAPSFFDNIDISIGATYYEVEIRDEIIELFSQTSINDCYNDPENDSPFCANISRENLGDGEFGLIDEVEEAFLNRDALKTRGVDVNLAIDWPTQIFGKAVDFSADFNANRKLEFTDVFFNVSTGEKSVDSDLGDFGLPEWEGQGILRADIGDWRVTWATRYLSSVKADPDLRAQYPFSNVDGSPQMRTCLGPQNGDVNCKPVGFADNYYRHDVSVYWYGDVFTVGAGVRNVTDEYPPLADSRLVFTGWNVPFGAGYDINGRQYFVNIAARFDNLGF